MAGRVRILMVDARRLCYPKFSDTGLLISERGAAWRYVRRRGHGMQLTDKESLRLSARFPVTFLSSFFCFCSSCCRLLITFHSANSSIRGIIRDNYYYSRSSKDLTDSSGARHQPYPSFRRGTRNVGLYFLQPLEYYHCVNS